MVRRVGPAFWLIALVAAWCPVYACAQTRQNGVPHYDLSIRISPEAKRLGIDGTVRHPASRTSRREIRLSLAGPMTDFRVEVIRPAESAGTANVAAAEKNRDERIIRPVRPIPPGVPVVLRVSYSGGATSSPLLEVTPDSTIAAGVANAWYPREGNTRGTGVLRFSVPPGYTVASTGRRDRLHLSEPASRRIAIGLLLPGDDREGTPR
jgi:hypothetical protein